MARFLKNKYKDDPNLIKIYFNEELTFPLSPAYMNMFGSAICVSIDIGIKNFAIRIEKREPRKLTLIFFDKVSFKENESGPCTLNPQVINNLIMYLNHIWPFLKIADLVIIERQLPQNYKGSCMFHILLSWFLSKQHLLDNCVICDVHSKLKSKMFNAGKMSYNELKKWSIDKAIEILTAYGDHKSLEIIRLHKGASKTKADDLADTVIQLEALNKYFN